MEDLFDDDFEETDEDMDNDPNEEEDALRAEERRAKRVTPFFDIYHCNANTYL